MILPEDLTEIGSFGKPHGINGEINAMFDPGIEPEEIGFIVAEIDGICVPFFISSVRRRGSESFLLSIDGIDNENRAKILANKTAFYPTDKLPESFTDAEGDGFYASDFIGWKITDGTNIVGEIVDFDDSTENLLFEVESADKKFYVPVADDLIVDIDEDAKTIEMELPEGISEL